MTPGCRALLAGLLLASSGCVQSVEPRGCTEGLAAQVHDLSCNAGTSDAPTLAGNLTSLIVAWEDNTSGNYEVVLRRSTDGGVTFGSALNVSGTSFNSGRPSVAIDTALPLRVYVAWEEATASPAVAPNFSGPFEVDLARSTDGGATFGAPVNLSGTSGGSFAPTVITALASVFVVWEESIGTNCDGVTPCAIIFRASSDGINFGKAVTLSKGQTLNAVGPKIVAHGGRIYVAWMAASTADCLKGKTGNCEIYFSRSLDGGVTWTDPFNLSSTSENSFDPDLVIVPGAADDTLYIAWDDGPTSTGEIFFRRSTNSGLSFDPTVNLSNTNAQHSSFPVLAALNSVVFGAWTESVGSTSQAYFARSTDGGATFSQSKNLSNTLFTVAFPRVTTGLSSHVTVWWEDYSSGPPEIVLARSTDGGDSFSLTNLSNNGGPSYAPRMIGDGKSGAAVWVDQTLGGAAEVFFRPF